MNSEKYEICVVIRNLKAFCGFKIFPAKFKRSPENSPKLHIYCVLFQAVDTVQQTVLVVQEEQKKAYVFDFIYNMGPEDKVLIFVGKKIV